MMIILCQIPLYEKPKWRSEPKLNTINDSYIASHRDEAKKMVSVKMTVFNEMKRNTIYIFSNLKNINHKLSWKSDSKVKAVSWENLNYKASANDAVKKNLFKVLLLKICTIL